MKSRAASCECALGQLRGTRVAAAREVASDRSLLDAIRAFAASHPDHQEFAHTLERIVERVEREFEGEQRARLLAEVRATLSRHAEVVANGRAAIRALEELERTQRRLLEAIGKLLVRPPGVTLH